MRVRVKICGVTTPEAIRAAARCGADAVGFVFSDSPRRLDPARARLLADELPPFVARVAVFRHPDPVRVEEVVARFAPDLIQSEPDEELLRALAGRVRLLPVFHDDAGLPRRVEAWLAAARPHAVLLEAPGRGGRGRAPDWDRAARLARSVPLVLAGGLTPDNVAEAVRRVRPFAVDVSSGVESGPGVKEPKRIERFLRAVRRAETGPDGRDGGRS